MQDGYSNKKLLSSFKLMSYGSTIKSLVSLNEAIFARRGCTRRCPTANLNHLRLSRETPFTAESLPEEEQGLFQGNMNCTHGEERIL